MKVQKHNKHRHFVQYNDGKIEHVISGPEYGQPWRERVVWDEFESDQFIHWVEEIQSTIHQGRRIRI